MTKRSFVLAGLVAFILAIGGFIHLKKPHDRKRGGKKADISAIVPVLKDGDLIFQTSLSSQSKAIQLATHSVWSHCGIIYQEGDNYFVYEAVQPVRRTPLANWIARGKDEDYVVKRLKNAESVLTPEVLQKMKSAGEKYKGKS